MNKMAMELGLVHTCNPSTQESEARGLQVEANLG
jgi:hypothetical protein